MIWLNDCTIFCSGGDAEDAIIRFINRAKLYFEILLLFHFINKSEETEWEMQSKVFSNVWKVKFIGRRC